MNPIRDALIGGVLPGAIATLSLLAAGAVVALHRGPLPPKAALPEKPRPMVPRGLVERVIVLVAMLLVGGGLVLSMRLLEPYPAWWPLNVPHRTPALVGIATIFAAAIAAGPSRWWFWLPAHIAAAAAVSVGIRGPLYSGNDLFWAVVFDVCALAPATILVQALVNRISNADGMLLARPLPLVAVALSLLPLPGILFFSGISVSSRHSGAVVAVLMSSAIVLAIVGQSAGRGVFRGVGVLAVLAIGVWMLLARTLGEPILSDWAIVCLVLAAAQAGIAAIVVARARRAWLAALITLALVGAPMTGALAAQYAAGDRGDEPGESPADYGY